MYDQFGMWDKALKLENKESFILVWENIKLFNSKPDLYTVVADGYVNLGIRFASLIVFDSTNNNCLSDDSDLKDSIITYFSNGIKILNSKTKFYETYNKAMLNYKYK